MMKEIKEACARYSTESVILFGDSIFDNHPYVDAGDSVIEQLRASFGEENVDAFLFAVDGAVMGDVAEQVESATYVHLKTDYVFLSCGGNDILGYQAEGLLQWNATSVENALDMLYSVRERFREDYQNMLDNMITQLTPVTPHARFCVCTVYDNVPGLTDAQRLAISVFNEVILQEAMQRGLDIIDLRTLCNDFKDYSPVSPIEPSKYGAEKMVREIKKRCVPLPQHYSHAFEISA